MAIRSITNPPRDPVTGAVSAMAVGCSILRRVGADEYPAFDRTEDARDHETAIDLKPAAFA